MSKDKKLRKILIDKLYHKNENLMKKSTRSNAPTESTPNEPKNSSKAIQNFFENFQSECAIIYEPVKLKDHRSLKRSLEDQLNYLFRSEKILNFKTQESQNIKPINYHKNLSTTLCNNAQNQNCPRLYTKNSIYQSKSRQNKIINTDAPRQNILKSKSMIFSTIPLYENKIFKQKGDQFQNSLCRQSSQSIRMQKSKLNYQKIISQSLKQENQYMTNSKNVTSKYIQKNAPIKLLERPQKVDRIKRIQSLKNLNQNGIRKYSYKREP